MVNEQGNGTSEGAAAGMQNHDEWMAPTASAVAAFEDLVVELSARAGLDAPPPVRLSTAVNGGVGVDTGELFTPMPPVVLVNPDLLSAPAAVQRWEVARALGHFVAVTTRYERDWCLVIGAARTVGQVFAAVAVLLVAVHLLGWIPFGEGELGAVGWPMCAGLFVLGVATAATASSRLNRFHRGADAFATDLGAPLTPEVVEYVAGRDGQESPVRRALRDLPWSLYPSWTTRLAASRGHEWDHKGAPRAACETSGHRWAPRSLDGKK